MSFYFVYHLEVHQEKKIHSVQNKYKLWKYVLVHMYLYHVIYDNFYVFSKKIWIKIMIYVWLESEIQKTYTSNDLKA